MSSEFESFGLSQSDDLEIDPTDNTFTDPAVCKFGCLNVQSILNDEAKRLAIEGYIQEKNYDFFGLNETWTRNGKELKYWIDDSLLLREHYRILTDHNNETTTSYNGKGTAIIYNVAWQPYIHKTYKIHGRFTGMLLKRMTDHIFIGSIYYPASKKDKIEMKMINETIISIVKGLPTMAKVIIMGDWNNVMNPSIDRMTTYPIPCCPKSPSSTRTSNKLLRFLTSNTHLPLVDIWRNTDPDSISFSHRYEKTSQRSSYISESRIDFALISNNLLSQSIASAINSEFSYGSLHHKVVDLIITLPINKLDAKYGFITQTRINIDFENASQEELMNYNSKLSSSMNFAKHSVMLDNDLMQPAALNKLYKSFTECLKDNARKHLPNVKLNRRTGTMQTKSAIPQKFIKTLRYLNQAHRMSSGPCPSLLTKIHKIYLFWLRDRPQNSSLEIHEEPSLSVMSSFIRKSISNYIKLNKKKKILERMLYIQSKSLNNVQAMLDRVLERKHAWKGLEFISDSSNPGFLTSKPEDVKSIITDHFKSIFRAGTRKNDDQGLDIFQHPDWAHIFAPKLEYEQLMLPLVEEISIEELTSYINTLGNHKAPGPDEISYEHLKFIKEPEVLKFIVSMLNYFMRHQHFPEESNKAIIILLSKIPLFNGDPNKLRPITLLSTIRKLFTGILNTRLQTILDSNNVLTGNQFGFMSGKSTNNYLTILRLIIDDAKLKNKELYIALLDIQKAYDSVPLIAIELSLRRLAIPEQFINIIKCLHNNRTLQISTPYGLGPEFTPSVGLPQGDKISCILWNIFYDPLLTKLQELNLGYTLTPVLKVSELAYADDLIPLSSNLDNLQIQLNTISQYLSFFHMKMNPTKSSIVSNRPLTNSQPIFIDNIRISDIIEPNATFRILGVFWTLNGSHIETLRHSKQEITNMIKLVNARYTPGPITTYIINAVILPTISYRLQLTSIPKSFINTVNGLLRKLVRAKYHLDNTYTNDMLYDKTFGIGLFNAQQIVDQLQISNALVHIRDPGITGVIFRAMANELTNLFKLPGNLLVCPVSKHKRNNPFLLQISNILFRLRYQFRTPADSESNAISNQLTMCDYNTFYKMLQKHKLFTIEDLKQSGDKTKMISYTTFYQNLTTAKKKEFDSVHTPAYFQAIISAFAKRTTSIGKVEQTFDLKIPGNLTPPQKLESTLKHIVAWTDGSMQWNNSEHSSASLGSAAILVNPHDKNPAIASLGSYVINPDSNNPSSTKSELFAQFIALQRAPNNAKLVIKTDSKSSIAQMKAINNPRISQRNILKQTNHFYLLANRYYCQQFETAPTFEHVRAHTNIYWNEQVDKLAKHSCNNPTDHKIILPPEIARDPQMIFLHQNNVMIQRYPAHEIKHRYQKQLQQENHAHIQRFYDCVINTSVSKQLSTISPKANFLDASSMFEQKFRIKSLTQSLSTKFALFERSIISDKYCPRCHVKVETQLHLWTCIDTVNNIPLLFRNFNEILESRKNGREYPELFPHILRFLKLDKPCVDFLSTLPAQGIIPETVYQEYLNLYKVHNSKFSKDKKEIFLHILDAWLSSFYHNVWKPRNEIVFNGADPPLPRPPIHLNFRVNLAKKTIAWKRIKLTHSRPPIIIRLPKPPLSQQATPSLHPPPEPPPTPVNQSPPRPPPITIRLKRKRHQNSSPSGFSTILHSSFEIVRRPPHITPSSNSAVKRIRLCLPHISTRIEHTSVLDPSHSDSVPFIDDFSLGS